MRSCVAKTIKPQAFSSALTKNATKAIVTRHMGNMARYASSSALSFTPSTFSRLSSPVKAHQVQGIRFYATEAEEVLKVPFLADSITKGEVAKIFKKVGDTVKTDETILSLDTDKTSAEINAPYPLVVVEILTKEGDSVEVGQPLVKIKRAAAGAATSAPKAEAPKAEAPKAEAPKAEAPKAAAPTSSPSPSSSSSPAAPSAPAAPKAEAPKTSSPSAASASAKLSTARTETREKMTLIRSRTAARLKDSQNTAAMLTTFQECDTTAVAELRAKFGEEFLKKHGVKLGFMSVFVKASVAALQDQPIVNAFIQDKDIVYRSYNDISVAVATPRGLVVPVLRDCQNKSMADIEKELGELGARARNNQVSIEEMVGGTFTISNGGVYGSLMGTPIINPPQSAILGMHGIFKRPVVVNDKVEIRPMMYIALTYDHRLIDGREAVTFLRKIKDVVEDPRRLLLEL